MAAAQKAAKEAAEKALRATLNMVQMTPEDLAKVQVVPAVVGFVGIFVNLAMFFATHSAGWLAGTAIVLCAAIALDMMTAPLLLALTFANGIGLALRWPVFSAIVPELVPRSDLKGAVALNSLGINIARSIGRSPDE